MIADCQADILTIVEKQRPAVILAIGPDGAAVFAAYLKSHVECRFSTIADPDVGAPLGTLEVHDLAFISRARIRPQPGR